MNFTKGESWPVREERSHAHVSSRATYRVTFLQRLLRLRKISGVSEQVLFPRGFAQPSCRLSSKKPSFTVVAAAAVTTAKNMAR